MTDSSSWGVLAPYKTAPLPPLPSMLKALGPGVIFMALAQGSGELIWWPYIIAKYGLSFLFLLLPACLLQFPVTYEIGRYTVLTGESIFQGFIRLQRHFAFFLWILMTLSFLWFGAFAAAGGTSLAALTNFPAGWSPRGQTLFWGYASMAVFLFAILLSKVIYQLVEGFMDQASKLLPLDQLALSPQCGFGGIDSKVLSEDEMWRKLDTIVQTATQIWGTAL